MISSNFVKFSIIQLNFDWMMFYIVKIEKPKIDRIYRLIGPNLPKFGLIHLKFGGIVQVIEV
jgi:hypothetical protein